MAYDDLKGWEKMQCKTFHKWTNMHLASRAHKIENLFTAFSDGHELACLLDILTESKVQDSLRPPEKIKMDIQKSENINKCIQHIESKGIKLLNIDSGNIMRGEKMLTLGLVWQIILNLDVVESEDQKNAKQALLLWCKAKTKGYANVDVQNFTNSWTSGLAFCALINKHKPGMLDFNSLDPADEAGNMQKAFDCATELGIAQLLDVEDMTNGEKPDEKSVMTQLFQWYKYFASGNKAETAARRIAKLVALTKQLNQLKEEYNTQATDWCAWASAKTEEHNGNRPENSLESVESCLKPFRHYQSKEKPPRSVQKVEIEALLANLQIKLKNSGRPAFTPAEGQTSEDIQNLWDNLMKAEGECGDFLKSELKRQRQLVDLVARFNRLAKKLDEFASLKQKYLDSALGVDSVSGAKAKIRLHDGFTSEFGAMNKVAADATALAKQIDELNYAEKDTVNERAAAFGATFQTLQSGGEARSAALAAELANQERRERQVLDSVDYANGANGLLQWAGDVDDDVGQSLATLTSVAQVNAQRDLFNKAQGERAEKEATLADVEGKAAAMQADGNEDFGGVALENVQSAMATALGQLDGRAADLDAADAKQAGDATLRDAFVAAADDMHAYIEATKASVQEESKGELQAELDATIALQQDRNNTGKPKFDALAEANEAMQAANIDADDVTNHNVETLSAGFNALGDAIKGKAATIQDAINANSAAEVPPEVMAEIKQTFDHFDKNKNGLLNASEFKGCLTAMGEDLDEAGLAALIAELSIDGDGQIKFNEFMGYMIKISQDQGTEDQIVEAFRVLTNNGPFITEAQMASVMSPEEVAYLTANMPQVEGGFDYQAWTGSAFA